MSHHRTLTCSSSQSKYVESVLVSMQSGASTFKCNYSIIANLCRSFCWSSRFILPLHLKLYHNEYSQLAQHVLNNLHILGNEPWPKSTRDELNPKSKNSDLNLTKSLTSVELWSWHWGPNLECSCLYSKAHEAVKLIGETVFRQF